MMVHLSPQVSADSAEDSSPSSPSSSHTCAPENKTHTCSCSSQLKAKLEAQKKKSQNLNLSVKQIQDFLEVQEEVDLDQHLLSPKILLRYAQLLDIVQPTCRRSVCFTKG